MKNLHSIAFWLVIIGGLNWFLVGLLGWDIGMIFGGQGAFFSRVFYVLIGISAFYLFYVHREDYCLQTMIHRLKKESPKDEVSSKNDENEVSSEVETEPEAKSEVVSPDSIMENNPEKMR